MTTRSGDPYHTFEPHTQEEDSKVLVESVDKLSIHTEVLEGMVQQLTAMVQHVVIIVRQLSLALRNLSLDPHHVALLY